ncbi:hypothetical protein GCM10010149_42230 [Nonomuraea roseoviolacea subsp. roseoviolacea]
MDATSSQARGPFAVEDAAQSSTYATDAAERLRHFLQSQGIAADVHDGYELALVSVCVGLVVWCDGDRFWWRSGWDARRSRAVYAWHPAMEADRAAVRVARRYAQLREMHPVSETVATPMNGSPRTAEGSR